CSEALANIAKYADASRARIAVVADDARLRVQVTDDGSGGADPAAGSGLRGLVDRVEALGGRLFVDSEPGRGTTLTAVLPQSEAVV
ncbi:MAG: sensor histidine kinase, partial [Gaiellaceae bacterium]